MEKKQIQHIVHSDGYNPGGIASIYLLEMQGFEYYKFKDNKRFDTCFVDTIVSSQPYAKLDVVDESSFSESLEGSVYKQKLSTFVRTLEGTKLSNLLWATANKYLVVFVNGQGKAYTFGSDGGVKLSFEQHLGGKSETAGYNITLVKNSIYPLFELDSAKFTTSLEWILEYGVWNGAGIWMRNGIWKTIEIK